MPFICSGLLDSGCMMDDTHSDSTNLRQRILHTAQDFFIQQGYHGVAMRQIAEALGVSKAALYYHFQDKEGLFVAVLEAYLSEMEVALDRIQAEDQRCSVRIRLFVEYALTQPARQRALIRLASQEVAHIHPPVRQKINAMYHDKFINTIRSIVRAGIEQGELRTVDADVATWSLLGIIYPYTFPNQSGEIGPQGEVIEEILSIYFNGVATTSGDLE